MTELTDLVEAYKREVSIPGAFATDFPTVLDDQIGKALGEAFGEAQLDGFFGGPEPERAPRDVRSGCEPRPRAPRRPETP